MKKSRILVLGLAFIVAAAAALLAKSMMGTVKTKNVVEERMINTTKVLVAAQKIKVGQMVQAGQLAWSEWPTSAVNSSHIDIRKNKNGKSQFEKSIARSSFEEGEPINIRKLIRRNQGGVMAAILTPGMRAISTKVKESTTAGGFILPNDRVDVILSRKLKGRGAAKFVSNTILKNVRVLAIGQNIEQPKGKQTSIGKTVTLELTLAQSETLTLANSMGTVSLALRSLSSTTAGTNAEDANNFGEDKSSVVRVLKFGRRVQGDGVQ